MNSSSSKLLHLLAIAEGISYLLFAVTVPLKRIYEIEWPNKIVGMAHGILFIFYVIWCYKVAKDRKWSTKTLILAELASLIPFGTFIADHKIFKKQ